MKLQLVTNNDESFDFVPRCVCLFQFIFAKLPVSPVDKQKWPV